MERKYNSKITNISDIIPYWGAGELQLLGLVRPGTRRWGDKMQKQVFSYGTEALVAALGSDSDE